MSSPLSRRCLHKDMATQQGKKNEKVEVKHKAKGPGTDFQRAFRFPSGGRIGKHSGSRPGAGRHGARSLLAGRDDGRGLHWDKCSSSHGTSALATGHVSVWYQNQQLASSPSNITIDSMTSL